MAEHLKKKFVVLPTHTRPWQFVHEDDLINVMTLLLKKRIGEIYNVTGEGTMSFGEMLSTLGNVQLPLPWSIIYSLNNLAWFLRLSFITKFPSPPLSMMVNPWIASNEKLIQKTGYKFSYNTREAFEDFANSVKGAAL